MIFTLRYVVWNKVNKYVLQTIVFFLIYHSLWLRYIHEVMDIYQASQTYQHT